MADLINATLKEEMRRNPRMVVFGEDVADCSREGSLTEVKGQRRRFQSSQPDFRREFGGRRCFNSPHSGSHHRGPCQRYGHRRIQAGCRDSVFRLHLAGHDADSGRAGDAAMALQGDFSAPLVIRVPIGGYLNGGSIYHSQSGEVEFTHIPGLRVVFPSNAEDAAVCCERRFAATTRCFSLSTKSSTGRCTTVPISRPRFHDSVRQSQDSEAGIADRGHLRRSGS